MSARPSLTRRNCSASLVLLLGGAAFACREAPAPDARSTASAVAAASVPALPSAAAVVRPWYEGTWTGSYNASLHRIELELGGVRAWKDDDGKAASGPGSVQLSVSKDGVVSGEAEGPLGPLGVTGSADDGALRLVFAPRGGELDAFRGAVVAVRKGDSVSGTLRASSGDSLTVRSAAVELTRTVK